MTELTTCPRCGSMVDPGDRFCASCGLRLPGAGRDSGRSGRSARSSLEMLVLFGPAIGGLIGLVIGEALVGQLSADAAVLLPIGIVVALGAVVGAPAMAWLLERAGLLR